MAYKALGEHQLWLESTALSDQHARLRQRHRRVPEARGSAHAARRLRRRSLLRERLVHANRRVRSPCWRKVLLGPPLAAQLLLRSSRVASGGFRDGKGLVHAKRRVRRPRWCRVRLGQPLACTTLLLSSGFPEKALGARKVYRGDQESLPGDRERLPGGARSGSEWSR